MCRSGWWQQRWGWCCVCPADGPVWVWKGNPVLYPLCICHLRPGGIVRHCAAGCQTARWRRQPRSGRPTRWRKPGDACCGRANRSYPKISMSIKWEQKKIQWLAENKKRHSAKFASVPAYFGFFFFFAKMLRKQWERNRNSCRLECFGKIQPNLSRLWSIFLLTRQTAACSIASKPPSGASRLPDILSFWSLLVKSLNSLVSLITFWKENGGSLLGQGWLSLRGLEGGWTKDKREKGKWRVKLDYSPVCMCLSRLCVHVTFSLLLGGSHVGLGLDHFVHELSEPDGVVVWQVPHQGGCREHIHHQSYCTAKNLLTCHHYGQCKDANPARCPSSSSCPNRQPWSWRSP